VEKEKIMSRKIDLEKLIRDTYTIINGYERTIQTSDRPEERSRSQRVIGEQKELIREYLAEYILLCEHMSLTIPQDINEIAITNGFSLRGIEADPLKLGQATQPQDESHHDILSKREVTSIGSALSYTAVQPVTISLTDIERITSILAKQANNPFVDSRRFFKDLLARTGLPQSWIQDIADVWTGNVNMDARSLIRWSINKGRNPDNPQFTTLGSILNVLLKDEVGFDDACVIAALIFVYRLYLDNYLLENLAVRYQIPSVITNSAEQIDVGPEIIWQGPTDELQLQSWLKPDPPVLDVGFLTRAIQRAASVCRVELPKRGRQGTGVLIADTLVLTNYHVLKWDDHENIVENANDVVMRFGYITGDEGKDVEGQAFKLNTSESILKSSSTDKLDYVLLRVEDAITQAKNIKPAPYDIRLPREGMGMNILQHPGGETMKLAIDTNGVTGVFKNSGLVQYVTKAIVGSSGSPCFNEDWKVVALHHAQRARAFGSIREGVLFSSIYKEIKRYLY